MDASMTNQGSPTGYVQTRGIGLRRQPDLSLLMWWMLAATVAASIDGSLIYFWGKLGPGIYLFVVLGGLYLGLLQALVLQRYLSKKILPEWTVGTAIGWFSAMIIVFLCSFFVLAGSGLNDTPDAAIRQCIIMFCGVAGAVFGIIQGASTPLSRTWLAYWTILNLFAWAAGGLLGGIVGFYASGFLNKSSYVDLFSPDGLLSVAIGLFIAMLVYGVITGVGVVWLLGNYAEASLLDRA